MKKSLKIFSITFSRITYSNQLCFEVFAYPDRDHINKSTVAPLPAQSHYGVNAKDSTAFGKSSMMTSNIGGHFTSRPQIQQSEMVSANLVAPETIQSYNSKLLNTKQQVKSTVQSKPEKKEPVRDQSRKKKKEGNCQIF